MTSQRPRDQQTSFRAVLTGPVRVEVREPVELLGQVLRTALLAFGLLVVGADETSADVLIWALDAVGGADALRLAGAPVSVLALVEDPYPALVAELVAAGARGVLARDSDPVTIAGAAIAIAGGCSVLPGQTGMPGGGPTPLTERELSWMRALARGEPIGGLAKAEGYSEREMYRKLQRIYRKVGAPGRTAALVALARANLLDAD
ncbi:MAG: Response regulator receiver protein [Actinomycetia bacterium]|nr:Response regulator receiver protein [Actinomycetes bacterium]